MNNKDAADLYKLVSTYETAGNQDRIFDHEIDLLEAVGYDLTLAGARLLGRDAARIADSCATAQILAVVTSEVQVDLLVSQMITNAGIEVNTGAVAQIFDCFRRGFLEARC